MKVMAAKGLKCPMEGKPRQYVTDAPAGVEVPDTTYYRRRLNDGSLLPVTAANVAKAAQAAPAKNEGGAL